MARVSLGVDDDDDELVVSPAPAPSLPSPAAPVAAASASPAVLAPEEMQPNPENPRPNELEVEETATDLRDNGQLQNINVMTRAAFLDRKPHLADQLGPAPYVVINGCRRLAGARRAGVSLRYDLRDDWTEDQIDEAVIRENEHRLALHPLHVARHLVRMLPRYEDSHRKLGKALGKTHSWVAQRVNLTKLHPDLQAAVEDGRVPFTLARECVRLHPDLHTPLASGRLPAEVAQDWVITTRLKPSEQLARWQAGPPYRTGPDTEPVPPRPAPRRAAFVLRLTERTPTTLASALREQLSADEVSELIEALRQSPDAP